MTFLRTPKRMLKMYLTLTVVAYAFNSSTQEAKVGESLISYWFEASLVYKVSSRLVRATY